VHVTGDRPIRPVGPAILTVSFVRDYSARVEYSWSDIRRATIPCSFVRFPLASVCRGVILATQCTYRPVRGLCVCARLGVPISKIAPLANEVTLYNRDASSMVLNEIG